MTEDAASVLEFFINDVANLPNEIAHIYEEIQAKDKALLELQKGIMQRDGLMQKFIKLNGSHVPNPKEEGYSNHIRKAYAQINILQDEKITFSQKALDLIERHIKRIDFKIKDLQSEGLFPIDPIPLPPNNPSTASQNFPQASSYFAANSRSASRRVSPSTQNTHGRSSSLNIDPKSAAQTPMPIGAPSTPGSTAGGHEYKRRRLASTSAGGNGPAVFTGMANSTSTPGSGGVGLARPMTDLQRSVDGGVGTATPGSTAVGSRNSGPSSLKRRHGVHHKRIRLAEQREQDEEEDDDDEDDDDEDEDEEGGDDKRLYCYCQQVSWGNMVACDDSDCKFEWFHWGCVNLSKEPPGKWYCDTCRERREKIKTTRS